MEFSPLIIAGGDTMQGSPTKARVKIENTCLRDELFKQNQGIAQEVHDFENMTEARQHFFGVRHMNFKYTSEMSLKPKQLKRKIGLNRK